MGEEAESTLNVREMLDLQLAEVEMLQSMFSNAGEFVLDCKTALAELRAFVDGIIDYKTVETRIGFTMHIQVLGEPAFEVELTINFPHEYPSVLPVVFTRASVLDRESLRSLRDDLNEFLVNQSKMEPGHILVGPMINWIQENAHGYCRENARNKTEENVSQQKEAASFTRQWIYSHHIYSKFKRRDIMDWANELNLNGFSMPGKPGIICVEGLTQNVDEFWYRIRRLNWKRIMIKEQEVKGLEGREESLLCKFGKFQELELEVHSGKGRGYHMDLGKFYEFLQQHDSASIFPMYFGVEGKNVGN